MNIFVLNCGSSSVKFQIIDTDERRMRRNADRRLARGLVERVGGPSRLVFRAGDEAPFERRESTGDHGQALEAIVRWVLAPDSGIGAIRKLSDIDAVGHRVVHGGERFREAVRIDAAVESEIEACAALAPLHNPANLDGIRAARRLFGAAVPQVAVFDTAFHAAMPEESFLYGIPYEYYRRHRIRRYGFHGTSHRYVCERYRALRGLPADQVNIVSLHLGNGCSACAVRNGVSFDTSMGFTPLEGLMMGTRSGDIDASIVEYLVREAGMTPRAIDTMLNEASGLAGLSGGSSDMRDLLEKENAPDGRRARLAVDIFCYRVRKYVGAYHVALGGADAVVFTGGIGENAPLVRDRIGRGLGCLGLRIDPRRNEAPADPAGWEISADGSSLRAFVIPTDEERLIARDTRRVVAGASAGP